MNSESLSTFFEQCLLKSSLRNIPRSLLADTGTRNVRLARATAMAWNRANEARHGKWGLEAYSLVEEADGEIHLVPQSPLSELGAEILHFEEEQSRSSHYEAEPGKNSFSLQIPELPYKYSQNFTNVQCSELFSSRNSREKEETMTRVPAPHRIHGTRHDA